MKKILFASSPEFSSSHELAMTSLRVFAGLTMALTHGLGKVPPPEMLVQGVSSLGFPMPEVFAWAAGLSEFLGGLFLALGLCTRPSAFFLAFTMLVAAFGVHLADPFGTKEMSLLYFFISLVFVIKGSGKWSVDHLISRGSATRK